MKNHQHYHLVPVNTIDTEFQVLKMVSVKLTLSNIQSMRANWLLKYNSVVFTDDMDSVEVSKCVYYDNYKYRNKYMISYGDTKQVISTMRDVKKYIIKNFSLRKINTGV